MCWLDYDCLKIGDILYCLSPYDNAAIPATQPHYAMVVNIESYHNKPIKVAVAYGTSKKIDRLYSTELLVDYRTCYNYKKTGLILPTKFDLGRVVWIPYDCTYFILNNNNSTPKVGNLTIDKLAEPIIHERLKNVKAYIHKA